MWLRVAIEGVEEERFIDPDDVASIGRTFYDYYDHYGDLQSSCTVILKSDYAYTVIGYTVNELRQILKVK